MGAVLAKVSPAKADFVEPRMLKDGSVIRTVHHRADPGISLAGHTLLTLLFYAAFVAYVVISTIDFVQRTPPETNSMMPSQGLPPIELDIALFCRTGTCGDLVLVENYTKYPDTECHRAIGGQGLRVRNVSDGAFTRALLCYTGEDEWSVTQPGHLQVGMIQAVFTNQQGFASVTVRSAADRGARINRQLGLDRTSVRSLHVGAEVEKLDGTIREVRPFALQYQAEGFREGTNRTEVLVWLASLANVRERRSGRTAWELVADFGSAFSTLQIFFAFLLPLWAVLFSVSRPLPIGEDEHRDGIIADALADQHKNAAGFGDDKPAAASEMVAIAPDGNAAK